MMAVRIRMRGDDLLDDLGIPDEAFGITWTHEWRDSGQASWSLPHDDPTLASEPTLIEDDNLAMVEVDTTARFPSLIRRKFRIRGGTWDRHDLVCVGAVEALRQALVYPPAGITGPPMDVRVFAWNGLDYIEKAGWGDPVDNGTYANPTHPDLQGDPGEEAVNEIQRVILDPDDPPFPWGADYPSPGGLTGTWNLVHRGLTTADIQWDADAAGVKAALEGLSNIDEVTVTGSGTSADPWLVEFTGDDVAGKPHPLMDMIHDDLRHAHDVDHVSRVQAGSVGLEGEGLIDDWPDDESVWLGDPGIEQHYRFVFTPGAAEAGERMLFVTSIDEFDVWFDGQHIGRGTSLDVLRAHLTLHQDVEHILAIRAAGPVMWSILERDFAGEVGDVIYRSQVAGVSAYGPGAPHGVTAGFLLGRLLDDAHAPPRQAVVPITAGFTDDVDSAARDWTVDIEIGLQIGDDSILSAAERLQDVGIFVDLAPDLTFDAWEELRIDRGGTPESGATTVTVPLDQARQITSEVDSEKINVLLARTEDTWIEAHIVDDNRRREGFVSLGTVVSQEMARRIALRMLEDMRQGRVVDRWITTSTQAVPQPYEDYLPGDVIVGPRRPADNAPWTTGDVKVLTVDATVRSDGGIDWLHETEPA